MEGSFALLADWLELPDLHALETCARVVRFVGVERRRDRETEEAQWLAKRRPDVRPDEERTVCPRTESEVDEDVSEQEQPSLRREESPVHDVLSFTGRRAQSICSLARYTTRRHLWTLLHCSALSVQACRRFSDWKKFGPSVRLLPFSQPRLGTAFVVQMVRLTMNHYRQYPTEGPLRSFTDLACLDTGNRILRADGLFSTCTILFCWCTPLLTLLSDIRNVYRMTFDFCAFGTNCGNEQRFWPGTWTRLMFTPSTECAVMGERDAY